MRDGVDRKPARARPKERADEASPPPALPLGGPSLASPLLSRPGGSAPRPVRRAVMIFVACTAVVSVGSVVTALIVIRMPRARVERIDTDPATTSVAGPTVAGSSPNRVPVSSPRTGTSQAFAQRPLAAPAAMKNLAAATVGGGLVKTSVTRSAAGKAADTKPKPAVAKPRPKRAQVAPAVALPEQPTRKQVISAMQGIGAAIDACFGATHGKAVVRFSVAGRSGRVASARVNGQPGSVGSCIARVVRRARFPKFQRAKIEISYPLMR